MYMPPPPFPAISTLRSPTSVQETRQRLVREKSQSKSDMNCSCHSCSGFSLFTYVHDEHDHAAESIRKGQARQAGICEADERGLSSNREAQRHSDARDTSTRAERLRASARRIERDADDDKDVRST